MLSLQNKPIDILSSPQTSLPICWTIAGSDSGGGAGIQADLKTFQGLGVYGCSVIAALTAQNTQAVLMAEPVSTEMLQKQLEALQQNLLPKALKIGMLASTESVEILVETFKNLDAFKVYDPVMISTSGHTLMPEDILTGLKSQLFPQIDLLTPNLLEAQKLTGINSSDVVLMAQKILEMGVKAVLIKGGHRESEQAIDYYQDATTAFYLSSPWVETQNTHGTGCTLSAAITAAIALGYDIKDAVVIAKAYVNQGLRLGAEQSIGSGYGPLVHVGWPIHQEDIPSLFTTTFLFDTPASKGGGRNNIGVSLTASPFARPQTPEEKFKHIFAIPAQKIGLYAVMPNAEWVEKLLPYDVPVIQLRLKNVSLEEAELQIKKAIEITNNTQTKLFINDYWQLAIKYQAYGVHLGQSDLDTADIEAIRVAGLRLGISTHCYYEVARALTIQPSYIAVGPVFETTTKQMPFQPQGLDNLRRWVQTLSDYPIVAIGGIFKETNAKAVWDMGVSAIAVVRDITEYQGDLEQHIKAWTALLS